jgi:hypothetical protein
MVSFLSDTSTTSATSTAIAGGPRASLLSDTSSFAIAGQPLVFLDLKQAHKDIIVEGYKVETSPPPPVQEERAVSDARKMQAHKNIVEGCKVETSSPPPVQEERAVEKKAARRNWKLAFKRPNAKTSGDIEGACEMAEREKWVHQDKKIATNCADCAKKFTAFRRRHHCRACGNIFCHACCCQRVAVHWSHYREGQQKKKRVCADCFKKPQSEWASAGQATNQTDCPTDDECPSTSDDECQSDPMARMETARMRCTTLDDFLGIKTEAIRHRNREEPKFYVRKIDPEDYAPLNFQEVKKRYCHLYDMDDVWDYWDEMTSIVAQG